jgi:hypothetical protein
MATSVQLPSINGVPIITYGLIGLTTLVLAYITFQDDSSEEKTDSSPKNDTLEKPEYDKPEYDKPEYDKPAFDKSEYDKPEYDKPADEDDYKPQSNNSMLSPFSSDVSNEKPIENQNKNSFMGGKNKRKTKSKKSKAKKDKKSKTKRRVKK